MPEAHGGAGLGLRDAFAVFEACGRHALPLPLAQTMLARALLAAGRPRAARRAASRWPSTAAAAPTARIAVGYGAIADWVLLGDASMTACCSTRARRRTHAVEAGSRSTRTCAGRPPRSRSAAAAHRLAGRPALRRGGGCWRRRSPARMRQCSTVTLHYANERSQFGRPIGKFQAIQHQLA